MRRAEKRVYNQWLNLRGYALGELDRLVRRGALPENIAAPIRLALYAAEEKVRALTIGKPDSRDE